MTMTLEEKPRPGFAGSLVAAGLAPEIPAADDIYGWLIGSWELEVRHYLVDLSARGLRGEVHFGRVLEGRAVQDVWIMPRRGDRTGAVDPACNMYGTTLRVWDAASRAWRVTWVNPVAGLRDELIGRRQGETIVQIGSHADGTPIRWIFSEIASDSFRWTGEALQPDGVGWRLEGEFRARRLQGM
jgi:hypothetical protein